MLLRQFPDIQWLKRKIRDDFGDKTAVNNTALKHNGWPTVVLNAAVKHTDRRDIKGPFSLFFNQQGQSQVMVQGRQYTINEQCYGLSNAGEYYNLLIDQPQPTETLNLHFGQHFFEQSVEALSRSHEALLDNPFFTRSQEFNLSTGTRPRNAAINTLLTRLLASYQSENEAEAEEEVLFSLLSLVLTAHSQEIARTASLPLKSPSTRQEIGRRLMTARELLHSHYNQPVSLDTLSEASCLSKFHFLRLFKQQFGQTPYQYQKQLRLERAITLYRQGLSLDAIAPLVGMENGSSVSRMFLKHTGVYPSQLKQ